MPTRPQRTTFSNSSVDVLNAIRNSASIDYRNYVPIATEDADVIREIGAVLINQPQLQNEFMQALINRIGRVLITSKMYQNPWSVFKMGKLELGETIEDIFVELATPFQYDPAYAASNVEARVVPDVRSAFYTVNYEKFYKVTTQEYDFRRAFLSMDGVTNLISKIIESMYTAANYDEYQVMKYMLYKRIKDGYVTPVVVDDSTDVYKELAAQAKAVSNKMTFMNKDYNMVGVHTFALKEDQYLILDAETDAKMDVNVLASAFNMDKAEFMGHRILIDSFNTIDADRVNALLSSEPNWSTISSDLSSTMGNVKGVIVDKDFWKVFDVVDIALTRLNEEGLYRNNFYHVHKIFATSPFANCAVFTTDELGTVTVDFPATTPDEVAVGGTITVVAEVTAEPGYNLAVTYSSSDTDVATVDVNGIVTGIDNGTATITAKSVADPTKTDTLTVTVGTGS